MTCFYIYLWDENCLTGFLFYFQKNINIRIPLQILIQIWGKKLKSATSVRKCEFLGNLFKTDPNTVKDIIRLKNNSE